MNDYFKDHQEEILRDYFTFLRFKSVSADPHCHAEVIACVTWLEKRLASMGFKTEIWQTRVNPTLFAELCLYKDAPTLLLYHHYDVQPVDPIEEWKSPPFEPTLHEGSVIARGAQDNKGQCFYSLLALKALLDTQGKLPINVKICIEGDEEIGSKGLSALAEEKQLALRADYLLVVDLGIQSPEAPAITLGTRGLITMEATLRTAAEDLHSGEHGGIALNPIQELVHLLSKLHDPDSGRVMVPRFYEDVKELSPEEKEVIDFTFDPVLYSKQFGASPIGGEKNYSPLESAWIRPTLEFNGIVGGYSGPGFKTVLPKSASCKLSCRLAAYQDPEKVVVAVAEFLQGERREGTELHLEVLSQSRAVTTSPTSFFARTVRRAYEEVFKAPCHSIMAGGSIGVVVPLQHASGAEVLFCGLGLPDDQIHAPNERFSLKRLEQGMKIIAKTLELLAS